MCTYISYLYCGDRYRSVRRAQVNRNAVTFLIFYAAIITSDERSRVVYGTRQQTAIRHTRRKSSSYSGVYRSFVVTTHSVEFRATDKRPAAMIGWPKNKNPRAIIVLIDVPYTSVAITKTIMYEIRVNKKTKRFPNEWMSERVCVCSGGERRI